MNFKDENSPFPLNSGIRIKGFLMDFSTPKIMGIINLSPDSFYAGSRFKSDGKLIQKVEKMIEEGADMIDLGAFSSRPGAKLIEEAEEMKRLMPALKLIAKKFPELPISVDTYRSEVALQAVNEGASIINDISGGTYDSRMFKTISELDVPYILMHLRGKPENMQKNIHYEHLVGDIFAFFTEQLKSLRSMQVKDVILDLGFGFGKTLDQNYQLLKQLKYFKTLACPILAGISRKGMIRMVVDRPTEDTLDGTTAAQMIALLNEVNILRVHDVKPAADAIKIFSYYQKQ